MDELQKWQLIHDRWSMNWLMNEPTVWLEAPFNDEPSQTLRTAETSPNYLARLRRFGGGEAIFRTFTEVLRISLTSITVSGTGKLSVIWMRTEMLRVLYKVTRMLWI